MDVMPKIAIESIPAKLGSEYPAPFNIPCATRSRRALGDAGGLNDFGVNLMTLPPGAWSSQRHWHSLEEEFVFVLEGEVKLIENDGEVLLRAGDCAAFPKNSGDGHHLVNESSKPAIFLEIGSRHIKDDVVYSDIDMQFKNTDDQFTHKDGTPY